MSQLSNMNKFTTSVNYLDIGRSRFPKPKTHKTTMVAGRLVPIHCEEILPGDTFEMDLNAVIRSLTPAVPVMDNAFLDVYSFWVPMRLCTKGEKDWQQVCGENTSGEWAELTEKTLANTGNFLEFRTDKIEPQSVLNYFGIPILPENREENLVINATRLRGFTLIYNEWFRDQNNQSPLDFDSLYSSKSFELFANYPYLVNKFHDYFTSSLPAPQKGDSVLVPLLGEAPVITGTEFNVQGNDPMKLRTVSDNSLPTDGPTQSRAGAFYEIDSSPSPLPGVGDSLSPSNLYADLSAVSGATINQLRLSFAIQRLLERDARSGTRYREVMKAHFGVTLPEGVAQVPEYLGGKRVPLNMTQVLSTIGGAQEAGISPLGSTGAFSNTGLSGLKCVRTKSFNEYGYVYIVGCIRTEQTYNQGIERSWFRDRRFDFYWPVFANLGEQAVLKRELYYSGATADVSKMVEPFGYVEAWSEYRYSVNLVTGYLSPQAGDTTLTPWTYTNKFASIPTLNEEFLRQPREQIDDTLIFNDSPYQFICDFRVNAMCSRAMPLHSIPGLIDHH